IGGFGERLLYQLGAQVFQQVFILGQNPCCWFAVTGPGRGEKGRTFQHCTLLLPAHRRP
ncbi:hypothetical protein LEMLEM_LOCUS15086, partial [Lemmus lemmus]